MLNNSYVFILLKLFIVFLIICPILSIDDAAKCGDLSICEYSHTTQKAIGINGLKEKTSSVSGFISQKTKYVTIQETGNEILVTIDKEFIESQDPVIKDTQPLQKLNKHTDPEAKLDPLKDRRKKVGTPNKAPWYMNGRLVSIFESNCPNYKNAEGEGSGIMVSPSCVLTCAHNLCLSKEDVEDKPHLNPEAIKVEFFPGLDGAADNGKARAVSYMITKEWLKNRDSNEDIALIYLDQPIGRITGYAQIFYGDIDDLINEEVIISGYPAEHNKQMYTMTGPVKKIEGEKIYYDIDTTHGNSGSGILINIDNPVCVGIHTIDSIKNTYNGGVGITKSKSARIVEWLKLLCQPNVACRL